VGKITQSSTAKVKPGIVVDQHPPAEKEVERNTPVDLWVEEQALPAARVAVPAVTKMDVKDADAILSKHGLRVGAIDREPSKAKPGWVLDQKPGAGIMVERNTEVSLLVAVQPSPPATVTVPRVTKMDVKDAEAELGKHGLRVGMVARQPTSKAKPGWVLHQNQAAGTSVERNATVNLLFAVDASRPSVRVPPIPKVSQKEAEGILAKHELRAGKITTRSGTGMKPGTVVGQWPWPETSIERNSAVELLVAK
jgi:serine/threonine-protein kinase